MDTSIQLFDTPATPLLALSADPSHSPIKKTELLQYYRETKQDFLNLGSMLIGLSDRKLYIFSRSGELSEMTILEA